MNSEEILERLCNSFYDHVKDSDTLSELIKSMNWTKAPDNPAKGIIIIEYTTGDYEFYIVAVHHGAVRTAD